MKEHEETERTIDIFTGSTWECELVKTMLNDAGISCFSSEYSNIYGGTPIFDANCRVRVMEEDEEAARDVVRQYQEAQS